MDAVKGVEKAVTINNKSHTIKIPKGVSEGSRIRFDEFDVSVHIKDHPDFRREGDDIISEKKISMLDAALGVILPVETVSETVNIKVPEGTQPDTLIRLKGKGMPHLQGNSYGDHYVRVKIIIPQKLSSKQKELLTELNNDLKKKSHWF